MSKKTEKEKMPKRPRKDWVATSIAFKLANLKFIKSHPLHTRDDVSVSWIINKLIEKFRAGEITLKVE